MTSERDAATRSLLVDTANRRGRRPWLRTLVIAVIAFLLGGGIAAGALSATAATRSDSSPLSIPQDMFADFLHGGRTLGPLLSRTGPGPISIDLGPRPEGATGIASFIECNGSGNFVENLGGELGLQQQCNPKNDMGFSSDQDPTGTVVSIKTEGDFAYTLWVQWILVPAPSAPSAAQLASLADGVITEAEYHAAVDRFAACMSGAGYPISDVEYSPDLSWGNSSDANRNGTVDRCGDAELNQVEKLWQSQQQ